jgi:Domain of unknown function (DUF5666)
LLITEPDDALQPVNEARRSAYVKRLIILLVAAVTAVGALGPAGAVAKGGHGKAHKAKKLLKAHRLVRGVVQSVGTDSITLRVRPGITLTVQVNANTKVVVNGQTSTLANVQIGYRARILVGKGGVARAIHAHRPLAQGTIVAGLIDSVGASSVTIKKRDCSSVTVGVTGDTKIRVNRHAATLADLHTGLRAVVVRTAPDGPAKAISATAGRAHGLLVKGVIASVGANSVTITSRGASVTIAVNGDTKVVVSGHAGALSDLQAGFKVLVLRASANGPAVAIVARPA